MRYRYGTWEIPLMRTIHHSWTGKIGHRLFREIFGFLILEFLKRSNRCLLESKRSWPWFPKYYARAAILAFFSRWSGIPPIWAWLPAMIGSVFCFELSQHTGIAIRCNTYDRWRLKQMTKYEGKYRTFHEKEYFLASTRTVQNMNLKKGGHCVRRLLLFVDKCYRNVPNFIVIAIDELVTGRESPHLCRAYCAIITHQISLY